MTGIIDHLPSLALLFFFGIFLWIAFQAYRPGAKERLQSHAFIPLKEDESHDQ